MWKKFKLFLAMSLAVLLVLSSPAMAAESFIVTQSATETVLEFRIDPRFDHMSRIAASLSVNGMGRANCTGTFTTYDSFDSTISMTLQQFKTDEWTAIKSWSDDYSGSGIKALDKGYYVPSGYRYRVVVVVQIWDTDGTELEKVSCDSPTYEY